MAKKVNPQILILAREARGYNQSELAGLINISRSSVTKMEQGTIAVSDKLINEIEKVLEFPKSFYYENIMFFRPRFSHKKRENITQKQLNVIDANLNICKFHIERCFKLISMPKTNVPVFELEKNTPEKVADKLRKRWKIPAGPIKNLTALMEKKGIIIKEIDFGTEKVEGRTMLTGIFEHPFVVLNINMPGDQQRFALACQLGHLVMHTFTKPSFGRDLRAEAELFAWEFLMPEQEIKKELSEKISIEKLAVLKLKWKVSMHQILQWANVIGAVSDNQKRYLMEQFNRLRIRKWEPAELDIPKEQPALLKNLMKEGKKYLRSTYEELAEIYCLTVFELKRRYF